MKTNLAILSLILFTFFTSCIKEPNCWGDHKNRGEIIDLYELPVCYFIEDTLHIREYIIRSAADLDTVDNCNPDPLNVDFTQHSIIGKFVTGGCEMKILRELTIDNTNNVYVYSITIRECGLCKKLDHNDQLVLVPAIPNDYTVRFEVEYK